MINLIEEQSEYPKLLRWNELSDSLKNKAIFRYYQDYPDLYNDMALDMMRPEYCYRVRELLKKYDYDFSVDAFPFEPTLYRIIRYSPNDYVFDRRISLPLNIDGDPFVDFFFKYKCSYFLAEFFCKV